MAVAGFTKPENARYRGATIREDQPEAPAQTWERNAFVFVDANGQVAEADKVTPANITALYAIDTNAASGVTDRNRNLEPLLDDAEVKMSIFHSGDPLLAITAQSLVGKQFAILATVDAATGIEYWVVDINNVADKIVQIQKIAPENPVGTQFGAVYVKVRKDLLQYQP